MSAEIFGSGTIPQKSDTLRMLLVKEVLATTATGGGASSGTGIPVTPPAAGNGYYYRTTTFSLYFWNPATSAWDLLIGPG